MRLTRLAWIVLVTALVWASFQTMQAQDVVTFEQVVFGATATGFATATITPTGGLPMRRCVGRLDSAPVMFRQDGTAPTALIGVTWNTGDTLTIVGHNNLVNFKAIRSTGVSGVGGFHCYQQ